MGNIDEISEALGKLMAGQVAMQRELESLRKDQREGQQDLRCEMAGIKQQVASLQVAGCAAGQGDRKAITELQDGYKKLVMWILTTAAGTTGLASAVKYFFGG